MTVTFSFFVAQGIIILASLRPDLYVTEPQKSVRVRGGVCLGEVLQLLNGALYHQIPIWYVALEGNSGRHPL